MIRRAFIKRFSAGVLGCGMLAEALLSRGPTMEVVETMLQRPVATSSWRGYDFLDLGPRVRDRDDMTHSFEVAFPDHPVRERRLIKLGVLHVRQRD